MGHDSLAKTHETPTRSTKKGKRTRGDTTYIRNNANAAPTHLELPLEKIQAIRETLALPTKPVLLLLGKRLRLDGRRQAVLVVRPEAAREVAEQDVVAIIRVPPTAPEGAQQDTGGGG